mmetsp:Transcript_17248/g.48532  ORF Transcript_17248/g.48532 Transcript_17248/m.48532 type:complete len:277 (+) Transcript_17248:255-1085(+)
MAWCLSHGLGSDRWHHQIPRRHNHNHRRRCDCRFDLRSGCRCHHRPTKPLPCNRFLCPLLLLLPHHRLHAHAHDGVQACSMSLMLDEWLWRLCYCLCYCQCCCQCWCWRQQRLLLPQSAHGLPWYHCCCCFRCLTFCRCLCPCASLPLHLRLGMHRYCQHPQPLHRHFRGHRRFRYQRHPPTTAHFATIARTEQMAGLLCCSSMRCSSKMILRCSSSSGSLVVRDHGLRLALLDLRWNQPQSAIWPANTRIQSGSVIAQSDAAAAADDDDDAHGLV